MENRKPPSAVAFVDLDRTLVPVHTSLLYLRMLRAEGHVTSGALLRAMWLLGLYFFNAVDMEKVARQVLQQAAGDDDSQGWQRGRRCVEQAVLPRVGARAREVLQWHAAQHHRVCILSGSTEYLVRPMAQALGTDGVGTRLAVDANGRLTGQLDGVPNFGAHKVGAAQRYAEQWGVPLEACFFYTDSASDLPLMERVGTPVAVNADPRLKKHARLRGWRSERW